MIKIAKTVGVLALVYSFSVFAGQHQPLQKGQLIFKNGQKVTIYVTPSEKRKLDKVPKGTYAIPWFSNTGLSILGSEPHLF